VGKFGEKDYCLGRTIEINPTPEYPPMYFCVYITTFNFHIE